MEELWLTVCNDTTESLSDKMRGVLHIPPEESVNAAAPLLDQGIDSLGAITVASWYATALPTPDNKLPLTV